jgi:AAA domain
MQQQNFKNFPPSVEDVRLRSLIEDVPLPGGSSGFALTGEDDQQGTSADTATFFENGYIFKRATYRAEVGPFAGNAFVEALPPLIDSEATWKVLRHLPERRTSEFFALPLHHRVEFLHDIEDIFVPTDTHADELSSVMTLVRRGYKYRNPTAPEVMAHIYRIAQCTDHEWRTGAATRLLQARSPSGGAAMGRMLFGPTGAGKTTLVNRITRYIGTIPIVHTHIGGRKLKVVQLPVVSVQCEQASDLKAMVRKVLENFDAVLGTDYALLTRSTQTPLWAHLSQLYRAATSNYLGLLIVDDLQRLKALDERTEATLQAFSTFMQATGIPILSVATNGVEPLLTSHLQEGRKLAARGHRELSLLPLGAEFHKLCLMMWEYRVSHSEHQMPAFFPQAIHHHTQGFLHAVSLLISQVFEAMAKSEGKGDLSIAMIESCAATLLEYGPSISILREVAAGRKPSAEHYKRFEHLLPYPREKIQTLHEAQEQAEREERRRDEAAKRQALAEAAVAKAKADAEARIKDRKSTTGSPKQRDAKRTETSRLNSRENSVARKQTRKKRPAETQSYSYESAVEQGLVRDTLD